MHAFLMINRHTLKTTRLCNAHDAAVFMVGRCTLDYIIIKNETTIIRLTVTEIRDMERQLEAA